MRQRIAARGTEQSLGEDGRIVDMKKDKCWDPVTHPYHAPGWC